MRWRAGFYIIATTFSGRGRAVPSKNLYYLKNMAKGAQIVQRRSSSRGSPRQLHNHEGQQTSSKRDSYCNPCRGNRFHDEAVEPRRHWHFEDLNISRVLSSPFSISYHILAHQITIVSRERSFKSRGRKNKRLVPNAIASVRNLGDAHFFMPNLVSRFDFRGPPRT